MTLIKIRKKVSKSSVNYRKASGTKECGNCDMYHPRHTECDLVAGVINSYMVCDRWVKAK